MAAILIAYSAQAAGDTGWVWVIPVVFVIFLLFGIWTRNQGKGVVTTEKPLASAGTEPRSRPRPAVIETLAAAAPVRPDDLVIIEGIGPKIAAILSAAGITTFAALAAASQERLAEIIKASGLRIPADPATWPDQAALAASGRWDDLRQLQSGLKAGRKA